MAVKPFSKEQLNFFKFCTLVLDEFPKVLRQIFTTMWDRKIATRPGFIPWDNSLRVRNMLLTSEGGKTDIPTRKSIEEWDCSALFKATIYAKTFGLKTVKPTTGPFHSSVRSSTGIQDETYALVIDQLRLLRNTLCHLPVLEIVKPTFDHYVQLVIDALTAVNIDTAFVAAIGQMGEEDFPTAKAQELTECRVKELQAIIKCYENTEQKLSSIDKRAENLEIGQHELRELTEKIENVQQKLCDQNDKILATLKNMMKNKENVPSELRT